MRHLLVVSLALILAACSGGTVEEATTTAAPSTTTTTDAATTTTAPPDCPRAPYDLAFVPVGVGEGELESTELDPDVWTSVPGTNTTFIPRNDDTMAIALVRGTLPAVDWPAEKGEVSVDGTAAVVGPHPDGTWVAGWFEEPGERCDMYTMVFYPPWAPSDVEQVLAGMDRVGG